eukprot:5048694-Prymnesium_polylepis.1
MVDARPSCRPFKSSVDHRPNSRRKGCKNTGGDPIEASDAAASFYRLVDVVGDRGRSRIGYMAFRIIFGFAPPMSTPEFGSIE